MDLRPWKMAERFGWTLDYIDSLPLQILDDFDEYMLTKDGLLKADDYIKRTRKGVKP